MRKGVPGFQGSRLMQARKAMGLTQTSLAELINVSKQAVSRYEKGFDSPSVDVLDRIRSILRHEQQFFLRPPSNDMRQGVCFYRSMAATTKRARQKAEIWRWWTREIISYLSHYIEIPPVNLPTFDVPEDPTKISMGDVEEMADELRDFWRLGMGPIGDLTAIAESNGILILRQPLDAETLDALSEWLIPEDLPIVVLNADKQVAVRSRLDLAHEIGHILIHRRVPIEFLRRTETFKLIEDQAFRFGAALLLPEQEFLGDLYSLSLDALRAQKPTWKVSVAMMIEWLKHHGMLDYEQHRRLRINYSARKWNRGEPLDDELRVEEPSFISKAIRLLIHERIQTVDQIVAATGFSQEWIQKLLSLRPAALLSPDLDPQLKVVEFRHMG